MESLRLSRNAPRKAKTVGSADPTPAECNPTRCIHSVHGTKKGGGRLVISISHSSSRSYNRSTEQQSDHFATVPY